MKEKKLTKNENAKCELYYTPEEQHETTFQETSDFLETHGWERISSVQYVQEKFENKHQTARIGSKCFFKLKKSNEEIKNAK